MMTNHLARNAIDRNAVKARAIRPGCASAASALGGFNATIPISGAKITATSHDTSSEMATTAKIENVYSLAALLAKPIGTKPAMVISVPASIGAASVL